MRIRKEGLDTTALAALLETLWPELENALVAGALVTLTDRSARDAGSRSGSTTVSREAEQRSDFVTARAFASLVSGFPPLLLKLGVCCKSLI